MWFVTARCNEVEPCGCRIIIMFKPWTSSRHGRMWLHWLFTAEVNVYHCLSLRFSGGSHPSDAHPAASSWTNMNHVTYLPPRPLGAVFLPLSAIIAGHIPTGIRENRKAVPYSCQSMWHIHGDIQWRGFYPARGDACRNKKKSSSFMKE